MYDSLATIVHPSPTAWQGSLFGIADPSVDRTFRGSVRYLLDDDCWVEIVPQWLAGANLVFGELVSRLDWKHRQVVMYERLVDEPRLTDWWSSADGESEPLPILTVMRSALARHYGRAFTSIGFNYYRDGSDSVAWHRDRLRQRCDAVIAIATVGCARPFLVRPFGGGRSRVFVPGPGDLLVMGGDCQERFEHCVPKVRAAGPRLSITFRHGSVDPGADKPTSDRR